MFLGETEHRTKSGFAAVLIANKVRMCHFCHTAQPNRNNI